MTIISPGDWDPEHGIVHDPVFASRVPKRRLPSRAERFFNSAVYAADQADRGGLVVSVETMAGFNPELKKTELAELLTTEKFQRALTERGIPLPSETGLSAEQLMAAAIYMDTTTPMSHAQKLRAAGITEAKWRGWLRQPAFAHQIAALSEESLAAAKPVALARLSQLADEKNLKAIELVLEVTGRHDRRKETFDVSQLMVAIFSVLDEEIAPLPGGVAVLDRIVGKVRAMMGTGQAPVLRIESAPIERPATEE